MSYSPEPKWHAMHQSGPARRNREYIRTWHKTWYTETQTCTPSTHAHPKRPSNPKRQFLYFLLCFNVSIPRNYGWYKLVWINNKGTVSYKQPSDTKPFPKTRNDTMWKIQVQNFIWRKPEPTVHMCRVGKDTKTWWKTCDMCGKQFTVYAYGRNHTDDCMHHVRTGFVKSYWLLPWGIRFRTPALCDWKYSPRLHT